jgi:beta-lactamase regulating signal transducer with metallopeptidase domain
MAWFLYVLLTGSLLAVAALALDSVLRRTMLPTRWVWVASLTGMALLAVIAPREQQPFAARFDKIVVVPSATLEPSRKAPGILAMMAEMRETSATSFRTALVSAERSGARLAGPLAIAWAVATAALLSMLVIVLRRANQARRRWPRADVHGIQVRVAPAVGPAVIGLARPDIVVPGWLMQRSADEQQLVVMHEREHLAARDQLLPVGAWIVAALLPWHPAVWWSMSRLRLAIELDCDARVLHRGVQPRSYGTLLIEIAGQCAGHRIGALALADRPSHLERRLLAMKSSRSRIGIARALTLVGVAALAVVAACEARLPTSAELDAMDAATIQKTAQKAIALRKTPGDTVRFYVNDLLVTESDAAKIEGSKVATVNVMKSRDGKSGEVRIKTVDGSLLPAPTTIPDTGATAMRLRELRATQVGEAKVTGLRTSGMPLSKTVFDGLIVIDGLTVSEEKLASLPRESIQSIEVVKGAAAQAAYADPRAARGVIKVVTKRP